MKFHFKRKYTLSFLLFIIFIAISVSFYILGPKFIDKDAEFFTKVLLISIAESIVLTIFISGLYRVNYFLYHDHLEIHRSLHKTKHLSYSNIKDIQEKLNDPTFLIFGPCPMFRVRYQKGKKVKTYNIRVERHDLLKLVLENEKKIHITTNK